MCSETPVIVESISVCLYPNSLSVSKGTQVIEKMKISNSDNKLIGLKELLLSIVRKFRRGHITVALFLIISRADEYHNYESCASRFLRVPVLILDSAIFFLPSHVHLVSSDKKNIEILM
jgi:hypothetical protein